MATNAERQAKWQAKRKSYITELENTIAENKIMIDSLLAENERLEAEFKKISVLPEGVTVTNSPVIEHTQEMPRSARYVKKSGWGNPGKLVKDA